MDINLTLSTVEYNMCALTTTTSQTTTKKRKKNKKKTCKTVIIVGDFHLPFSTDIIDCIAGFPSVCQFNPKKLSLKTRNLYGILKPYGIHMAPILKSYY